MSQIEPISTSAMFQAEIQRLQDRSGELTASLLAAQTSRDALQVENARQARQITEQSVYIGNLTRELGKVRAENGRLKAGQPRPAGKHYPQRLGNV